MSEYIADSLLDKLGLNRANLLYVGGGHAYFVLANTEKTVETLVDVYKRQVVWVLAMPVWFTLKESRTPKIFVFAKKDQSSLCLLYTSRCV